MRDARSHGLTRCFPHAYRNMSETKNIIIRRMTGVVVSNKADKTLKVRVDRLKMHPKYKKRYTVSKSYAVHDERNQFQEGDVVEFVASRPYSKTKRWRVVYGEGMPSQPLDSVVDTDTQTV